MMKLSLWGWGIFFAAFIMTLSEGYPGSRDKSGILEQCGDMAFSYTPDKGVTLKIFDISLVKENSLWVVTPGWLKQYYNVQEQKDLIERARVEDLPNGKKITLYHDLPPDRDCPFSGTQSFILTKDNTFTAKLDFTFSKDTPALFEWGIGCINPALIIGKPYIAWDDQITTKGIIPVEAMSADVDASTVARRFRVVTIRSRIGEIKIESSPKQDLLFFDYRKNRWAQSDNPYFWLGFMDHPIPKSGHFTYSVRLRFPSERSSESTTIPVISEKADLVSVNDAQIPHKDRDYIIPTPKKLEWTGRDLPLSSDTMIYIGKNPGAGIERAVSFLLKDLKDIYNIEPRILREALPEEGTPKNSIVFGERERFPAPARACELAGIKAPEHPEGYAILADDRAAFITANTERGVFYGITSLVQMIKISDQGIFLKGAKIEDYPSLDFRGIHCLTGKNAGDEISKAVRDLMARFKINTLVWECEYLNWDSHPEIAHREYGMDKKDAQKVVDAARENFIEIIPLIPSLGHVEWIFTNDRHLDLAEDPDIPYAICPTNPDSYKFLFSIYQEALDFFKPRYFHIGHDEVTMRGQFPSRSRKSGKSATELIMGNINTLKGWLADKGVKTMLWGDMFLWRDEGTDACLAPSPEDAAMRRSLLARDVIITDWHYEPAKPEEYKTLKIFRDLGIKVIGAGWFTPNNIRNLAKACVLYKAEGYLQTTWAGFNFKINGNEKEWRQYWAYLLAAEYAWTGENMEIGKLPFNAQEEFLDLWFEKKPVIKARKGYMFDLTPFVNRKIDDDENGAGWAGLGPDNDLSALVPGDHILDDTHFRIGKNGKGESAMVLAGKFNPPGEFPQKADIRIEPALLSEIHILLTALFPALDGTELGQFIVNYEDGSKATVPLVYGKNIFSFEEERTGRDARIAWRGNTRKERLVSVWDFVWKNPKKEKAVRGITMTSDATESAPAVLAMTGIE